MLHEVDLNYRWTGLKAVWPMLSPGARSQGDEKMTERAEILLNVVMDMISGTLDIMSEDKFHSPPGWILENWWNTLSLVRREITSSSPSGEPSSPSADSQESSEF